MNLRNTICTVVAALALCTSAAFAQDQKQDTSPIDPNAPLQPLDANPAGPAYPDKPPIGAVRGVITPYDPEPYDPAQVTPDTNTLAGATPLTLGSLQHTRNIFDPTVSVSQIGQFVPGNSGNTALTGVSQVNASLNFNRTWSEYHFSAAYNGGESFDLGYGAATTFFGQTYPHNQFHDLSVTQEAAWARWHVLVRDDLMISPGAAFTGQGMGGPGLAAQFSGMLGGSLTSLGQQYQPNETVNTGQVMRFRDSLVGQAQYSLSRRSELTFSANYGLLDFNSPGYFNSTMFGAQAGYDYQLDRANSIAILGGYGRIDYTGTAISATGIATVATGNSTTDYVGALAYGRRITGRLAFQVAVGPQDIVFGGASGTGNYHLLFALVNSSLSYERRRSGLSFSYARGLTAGSGVTLGATSNTFSGSAHYQFTRFWTGTLNAGYALNVGLAPAGTTAPQFDTWFAGANLGRRIGPHAQVNFNYGATRQNNPAICLVASCGGIGLEQTVGMTVNWHLRPTG